MEEMKKQLKLVRKNNFKKCVGLTLLTPFTVLVSGLVITVYSGTFLLGTYGVGEHVFKRDYNTSYAYTETIDTFDTTHTTTSEINYDGYESILGDKASEKDTPVLPKSYVTEYGEWEDLGNGEYARNIRYYDASSFDYEKALKLLTGTYNNQDINIEEYFQSPSLEEVEVSKTKTNNTKYQLTYYSIDEEKNIVTKESHGEHASEIILAILVTLLTDAILTWIYVLIMSIGNNNDIPMTLTLWLDLIDSYSTVAENKRKIKELKQLIKEKQLEEEPKQKIK